jgi:hypothetical protein
VLELWPLLIPGVIIVFIVGIILNTIFNPKPSGAGGPIVRAPAGSSDSSDSSFTANTDFSTYPGSDSSPDTNYSDSSSSDAGSSDSGSSGGGDGGGGGGGD